MAQWHAAGCCQRLKWAGGTPQPALIQPRTHSRSSTARSSSAASAMLARSAALGSSRRCGSCWPVRGDTSLFCLRGGRVLRRWVRGAVSGAHTQATARLSAMQHAHHRWAIGSVLACGGRPAPPTPATPQPALPPLQAPAAQQPRCPPVQPVGDDLLLIGHPIRSHHCTRQTGSMGGRVSQRRWQGHGRTPATERACSAAGQCGRQEQQAHRG